MDMIGRDQEWSQLKAFAQAPTSHSTLGMVWGRRRVGKSFLLSALVEKVGGLYYEAVRGSSAEALRDLGARIGAFTESPGPLALESWDDALDALMSVGQSRPTLVVLDEYPYLREHTPELDSLIQRAFGPDRRRRSPGSTRLILCGSAITVMRDILSGTAPLRGRAGLDLPVLPFDFRTARKLHGISDLPTALRTYAVIGGVAAYAHEMVSEDLPDGPSDFDRWVCRRVLTPAAPLFNEVPFLLSEDPSTSKARKLNLYHAVLAGIATGHHAHTKLTRYVKIRGASLTPIVDALVAAELVHRSEDPLRDNRPTYQPGDPLIRFHYAVIRRHSSILSKHSADTARIWREIRSTFEAQVLGPCFEELAREWTLRFAAPDTLGGRPEQVGPTTLTLPDGNPCEVDIVAVRSGSGADAPGTVLALGEAKVGARLDERHLSTLEEARSALGARAANARLLLFGSAFSTALLGAAEARSDVELVDLERLYHGD